MWHFFFISARTIRRAIGSHTFPKPGYLIAHEPASNTYCIHTYIYIHEVKRNSEEDTDTRHTCTFTLFEKPRERDCLSLL